MASDAIGMGLNLNIARVILTDLTKWDGKAKRPLSASEVRQIAGRAGRFKLHGAAASSTTSAPSSAASAQGSASSSSDGKECDKDSSSSSSGGGSSDPGRAVDSSTSSSGGGGKAAAGSVGWVTCLKEADMPLLHEAMAAPHAEIQQACLMPRCA